MTRFRYRLAFLLAGWLVLPLLTSCDPGSELVLEIRNQTNRSIQVKVPEMAGGYKVPISELPGIDVTLKPSETKTVDMVMSMGSWPGSVRAYADGNLIFCQEYRFTPEETLKNGVGTYGGMRGTYSVEIVEGHIACGPSSDTAQ